MNPLSSSEAIRQRSTAGTATESFPYIRVETPADIPSAQPDIVDVVVLDMNHRWPNMGHDAIVNAIGALGSRLTPFLGGKLSLRVLSFDVRACLVIPESPGDRFQLYLGTGGPGHLDPLLNDGESFSSQGIKEDPSWQQPVYALFDSIKADPDAALIAVCHTFGVLCRWSGIARPVLRGLDKGGKSSGVVENVLTAAGLSHPWFKRFQEELPVKRHFKVIDSRLFDLIPDPEAKPDGAIALAFETGSDHQPGEALTMAEFARDRNGIMPRMLAVNHHPEVIDRTHAMTVLREKFARAEVSYQWYHERAAVLTAQLEDPRLEAVLRLTSQFTFIFPLQYQLMRILRMRSESLGFTSEIDERLFLSNLMDHARE